MNFISKRKQIYLRSDSMESSDLIALEEMLAKSLTLEDKNPSEEILESITHYFRELRGLCSKGAVYQDTVAESNIIQHATEILSKLIKDPYALHSEPALVCIRVGIQFLGNFIVDNVRTQGIIWQQHKSLLWQVYWKVDVCWKHKWRVSLYRRNLLSLTDPKAVNFSAMVVFNVLKDNLNVPLEEILYLFPVILDIAAKESEFGYVLSYNVVLYI